MADLILSHNEKQIVGIAHRICLTMDTEVSNLDALHAHQHLMPGANMPGFVHPPDLHSVNQYLIPTVLGHSTPHPGIFAQAQMAYMPADPHMMGHMGHVTTRCKSQPTLAYSLCLILPLVSSPPPASDPVTLPFLLHYPYSFPYLCFPLSAF
jgi:hypothetical protein